MPCKFVGNPKPTQLWINPRGKVIEHDEKYAILPEGGLRIRNIEWSDMGEFICSVENSVGVDSVETFLYPMKVSRFSKILNESFCLKKVSSACLPSSRVSQNYVQILEVAGIFIWH